MEFLKITNLFSNQVNYRNIYKILRQIPDDSFSATVGDRKKKAIAKACNIYEYWCLVKILWIFIKEYGFCLVDEAGKDLNNKNSEAMIKKLIKSYFVLIDFFVHEIMRLKHVNFSLYLFHHFLDGLCIGPCSNSIFVHSFYR